MISTVHIDRHGYVVEVYQNTRIESLDVGKFSGELMEVTGPVCPGMRFDGQTFVSPPARVPPEAVADERARRQGYFPERLLRHVMALGGANAVKVSNYLASVHRVAESMLLTDPPRDFKDDRHWPTPPILDDHVQRVVDVQTVSQVSAAPITVHVHTPEQKPLVIQHEPASRDVAVRSAEPVEIDDYGLSPSDPLYDLKVSLVMAIRKAELELPEAQSGEWKEGVAGLAALATAARDLLEFELHADEVLRFSPGVAQFIQQGQAA